MADVVSRPAGARLGVSLLFGANGAVYGAWAAAVPAVKAATGASDGALGGALLCVALGAMAAMPVVGWLSARRVPRLLGVSGLALAAAVPLPALAPGVPALCAALLLLGIAAGSLDVTMNARASRIEQGWGVAIMSSFHAAFSLGGLVGTGVVAASEGSGLGALAGLVATGLLMLAATAAHAVLDPRAELAAAGGARAGWPRGPVVLIGVCCALAFLTEGAVADWSGVYLSGVAGFGTAAAASGFAAFSAGMVVMRLLGDAVVRRLGPVTALRAGGALAGLGVLLAIAVPQGAPAGFLLVGLGAANAAPVLFSAAGRIGPTALAAAATLGYGGMLLGPPVIGGLAELAGLRAALGILLVAVLAIALGAGRVEVAHGRD